MTPVTLAILPARNEAEALPPLLRELGERFPSLELLVVDDGSSDGTAEAARAAGAHHVLRLPCNLGIGGAVQAGMIFALRRGYARVVRLDADGQHDPAGIPTLLAALEGGADLAIGSRFAGEASFRTSFARRSGIRLLSLLTYLLTGREVRDVTSGFRAYGPRALALLTPHYPQDYPEPDETVMLLRAALAVAEVPVAMRPRQGGETSIRRWRSAFYMAKVSLSMLMTALREGKRKEGGGR